jgi:hypothetical protein
MKVVAPTVDAVWLAAIVLFGLGACGAEEDQPMNVPAGVAAASKQEAVLPERANHLAGQTSPYLLQHAHNPVDWYPWGEEALARAKAENKPIFLSIGYSACHWCHVMERESFEDPQTAKILNAHFISIKVDREERPDLDEIYMTAVQIMTGRGGWPMSVFLTPDLKPFFGGTYFPPEDRFGMPGFKKLLSSIAEVWEKQPDDVAHNAQQMVLALRDHTRPSAGDGGRPDAAILSKAVAELEQAFDPLWGGFGTAPKFPPGGAISLLLRQHARGNDTSVLAMARVTLDRMATGGIHDQIGGGFHRYSVDGQWLVPHFEKMLYDNAILARVYLDAWLVTGHDLYRQVATGIFAYVLRDMTDPGGGFYSSEDADSEGEEGKFYVWRLDEIASILGDSDGRLFSDYYGVTAAGNFEGQNILHIPRDPAEIARDEGITADQLAWRMGPLRQKLLSARSRRVRPGLDDKVLAAWNGMMISALARGSQVLGDERYLDAARKAADFVLSEMVRDGVLLRTYRASENPNQPGTSKLPGYLDDYAEMSAALIDLYEATFEIRWLEAADSLARKMTSDFWDDQNGGFFYTSADHKNLLVRTKPFYDGAVPSGNATATMVLLRLWKLLDNNEYFEKAERTLFAASSTMRAQGRAHLDLLCAADFYLGPLREIAIVGAPRGADTAKLLDVVRGKFLPNKVVALVDPDAADADLAREKIPLLAGKTALSGKATAYVCEGFVCKQPVGEAAALEAILEGLQDLQ